MQEGHSAHAVRVLIADDVIHAVAGIAKLADYADVVDVVGLARQPMALFEEARLLSPDVVLLHEGFGNVDTAELVEELTLGAPDSRLVLIVEPDAVAAPAGSETSVAETVSSAASGEELVAAILSAAGRGAIPAGAVVEAADAEAEIDSIDTVSETDAITEADPTAEIETTTEFDSGAVSTDREERPAALAAAPTEAAPSFEFGPSPSTTDAEGVPVADEATAAVAPVEPMRPRRVRRAPSTKAEVFIVFAGKGGVGKSLVATNLAVALSHDGSRVAILDLDLQFGDVAVMLHVEAHPTAIDALAQQGEQPDSDFIEEVMAVGPEDVRILLAPASPEFADLVTTANLRAILREMSKTFDYIVVDAPAHLEERTLEVIELADQIIVVTGFNITSVKDTKITLKLLQSLGIPQERIAVVLNQTRAKVNFPRSEVESSLRFRVVAQLPFEPRVDDCIDNGRPIVLAEPKSEFTKQFRTLVDYLSAGAHEEHDEPPGGERTKAKSKANRRRFSIGRG